MNNLKVRIALIDSGIRQYQLAKEFGWTAEYLSKLLRYELPEEKQNELVSTIYRLKDKLKD